MLTFDFRQRLDLRGKVQRHIKPHIFCTGALLPIFMGNTLALFMLGFFQTILLVAIQRLFLVL